MPKYFTRDEAEALLPRVEPLLGEIQSLRASLNRVAVRLSDLRTRTASNGHSHQSEITDLHAEAAELGADITLRIQKITELGVLVKDLDVGLIDFPAYREGREVYLCWRIGEEGISWWHDTGAGFAGRQPLDV